MNEVSFKDTKFVSDNQVEYENGLGDYFHSSVGTTINKLGNFTKFVPRESIARFLIKYEMFKEILDVQGVIIECGVLFGGGLMTWAQLSAIMEPANHQRRIVGFDTFEGFPSISKEDKAKASSTLCEKGELAVDSYEDLLECIRLYDKTRCFNHLNKVELVRGDVLETIPLYIEDNPHLVVSLLYLDFDVYKPTKNALEHFLPRMPKGSIVGFDQLNQAPWPGETVAVLKQFGNLSSLRITKQLFGTSISYFKIGS